MTDVATVTGQVTARHGAGAKSAGAAASTGTGLDGAFAALLGAAGQMPIDGGAVPDGKAAQPTIDPALVAGDPAFAAMAGEVVTAEGDEDQPLPGHIDPASGKPRKSSRGKDAVKGDDSFLQAQATMAGVLSGPVQLVSGEQPKISAKAAPEGIAAIEAASAKGAPAATTVATSDVATAAQAVTVKDGKGDKPAKEASRTAPAAETVAGGKDQAAAQTVATNTDVRQQGDQSGDGRSDPRDKRADKIPVVTLAANDDATAIAGTDPLRDIVQSLPPVVQAQLGPIAPAGAAPVTSTGDMLSSHVIDMSVSGQWIDRMAREIATVADGGGNARFQLSPPNLGRIQVELMQADDKTNVRVLAETDEAARRLREGQAALEAHARSASLSLGSVSVEKSSAPFESGDKQNQRQGAEQNANSNQQNFAQAQGQSAQGRNNNSNGNLNRGGFSAVMGSERLAEPEQGARTTRASDPRVRFA
ncbi:MAG TPA: flagellar hook-length control protein FliK [Sphingobium sp.]